MTSAIFRGACRLLITGAVSAVMTGCAIPIFDEYPERIASAVHSLDEEGMVQVIQELWRHPNGFKYEVFTGVNNSDFPVCLRVWHTPQYYREYSERSFVDPVPPGGRVRLYEYDHRPGVNVRISGKLWDPRDDGLCYAEDYNS